MTNLKKYLLKNFIVSFVKKQCSKQVPTLGGEAPSINCYYLYVYSKSERILVVRGVNESGVWGKFFNKEKYCEDACIPFEWIDFSDIRVTHFYKGNRFEYSGPLDYCLSGFTRKNVLHAIFKQIFSSISQFFFNRKKLFMVQKHELLKVLIQNHIESTHKGIDTLELMTKLYSIKWILHPKGDEVETKLELYLDSLAETGEISKIGMEYVVNGKAINTIEEYEAAERRHQDNVKSQRRMVFLTVILVIFALVQAGVIKLPTLIDLSGLK